MQPRHQVPRGFWNDKQNHRIVFDQLARQFSIHQPEDWYKITAQDLCSSSIADIDTSSSSSSSSSSSVTTSRTEARNVISGGAVRSLLTRYYGNSLLRALQAIYPEHTWDASRFSKVPNGFWNDKSNHRRFFDRLAREEFGIVHLDDWLRVSVSEVKAKGGGALLRHHYGGSLIRALQSVYPEHSWQVAGSKMNSNDNSADPSSAADATTTTTTTKTTQRRHKAPNGYWKDLGNQRRFFEQLAKDLGVEKQPEDWYKVTVEQVCERGGGSLLNSYYGGSLLRALHAVYPEYSWMSSASPSSVVDGNPNAATTTTATATSSSSSSSKRVPMGHWKDRSNHRRFFESLGAELGVKTLDDWYNVSAEEVHARGGTGLLNNYYGNSLARALQSVFPERSWQPAKLTKVPRGYWNDPDNRRRFFDQLARELGVRQVPHDWYRVTLEDVCTRGAGGLINQHYGGSLAQALMSIYPEYSWESWRFSRARTLRSTATAARTPVASTDADADADADAQQQEEVLKDYINALERELHIGHLDDWYRVSERQLQRVGGYGYIERNGGLLLVLKRLYPHHNWDESKLTSSTARSKKRASQRALLLTTRRLFPDEEIVEEFVHPDLRFEATTATIDCIIKINC